MLEVHGLAKSFGATRVFAGVDLTVAAGEVVALVGESGVGKSTLLNCIAGLEPAEQGSIVVAGAAVDARDDDACARLRRRTIGFVFQAFHVLPHLTVGENIGLPLLLQGRPDRARVAELVDAVGLAGLALRLPSELSGGQLQRVAIARAVVHRPALVLADEPTGNLDPATAARVLDLLVQQTRSTGAACLLATHAESAAARADRVLRLTPLGIAATGAAR